MMKIKKSMNKMAMPVAVFLAGGVMACVAGAQDFRKACPAGMEYTVTTRAMVPTCTGVPLPLEAAGAAGVGSSGGAEANQIVSQGMSNQVKSNRAAQDWAPSQGAVVPVVDAAGTALAAANFAANQNTTMGIQAAAVMARTASMSPVDAKTAQAAGAAAAVAAMQAQAGGSLPSAVVVQVYNQYGFSVPQVATAADAAAAANAAVQAMGAGAVAVDTGSSRADEARDIFAAMPPTPTADLQLAAYLRDNGLYTGSLSWNWNSGIYSPWSAAIGAGQVMERNKALALARKMLGVSDAQMQSAKNILDKCYASSGLCQVGGSDGPALDAELLKAQSDYDAMSSISQANAKAFQKDPQTTYATWAATTAWIAANTPPNAYLAANPNAALAYANRDRDPQLANTYGLNQDQFQSYYWEKYGSLGKTYVPTP